MQHCHTYFFYLLCRCSKQKIEARVRVELQEQTQLLSESLHNYVSNAILFPVLPEKTSTTNFFLKIAIQSFTTLT